MKKKDEEKRKKRKYDKMKLVEFVLNENDADVGVLVVQDGHNKIAYGRYSRRIL